MSAPTASGVVLVGGGVAAVAAARALRRASYDGRLVLVNDEPRQPYDRPPLSKQYLAGTVEQADVGLFASGEVEQLRLDLRCGTRAVGLNAGRRVLELGDGTFLPYRALVVATGAGAKRLPLARDLVGIHYLRSSLDADALRASLAQSRRLVVIGAGFIGLEVAATARAAGLEVTVIEAATAPLTRVLGPAEGEKVADLHRQRGVDLHCGTKVLGFVGEGRVSGVAVTGEGGEAVIPADTVIVGVGATPHTNWLDGSGVTVDDGVVCDAGGRTSTPGVYAAGDASRWVNHRTGTHARVEQWQSAVEQGTIVGANIAAELGLPGAEAQSWSSVPYFWSDQYEHKVQFCGATGPVVRTRETPRGWVTCYGDAPDGSLCGVLAVNGPALLARGRQHIARSRTWRDAVEWLETL